MNRTTIKDSLMISEDLRRARCKGGCELKYARKLINDWLKVNTLWKGGWTVWFEVEVEGIYYFKLTNPYKEMHDLNNPSS